VRDLGIRFEGRRCVAQVKGNGRGRDALAAERAEHKMASGKKGVLSSLLGLHQELERMIHDVVGGPVRVGSAHKWVPPADIFVCRGNVIVRFEVAGVKREDFDLTYKDDELTVRGMRAEFGDDEKEGYWQMEIPHGPFERKVKIPLPVDPDKIEATCREGILEVKLPIIAERRKRSTVRIQSDA
jgi:HSP20 family protein